ncbi:hypothetical protein H2200_004541 [Cladophialophora chaetospira]|uniref:Uncharacterized protein n=1 Tax=Cladophialophora chaetospira TaxID=386627 RepID=A0AA39CJK4_9EURO|nr:hypothetical protein H2200_004541 [Cladophialophora chaetospira]
MAPRRTPLKPVPATPVRQMTRPSRYRTPAVPTAGSTPLDNSQSLVPSTPTPKKTKSTAKTPSKSKATPAKPKHKPKATPKKTPRGKATSKAPSKKASTSVNQTTVDNGDSGLDVVSNTSELSPTRSISPPPGFEVQNSATRKRRHQDEDPDYEDAPTVKRTTKPLVGSNKKKKGKKTVTWASDGTYKPEAESGEEEEAPLSSTPSRKRKSRPPEDQEYKRHSYEDDPEDGEMEDLLLDQHELDFINDVNPRVGPSRAQYVDKSVGSDLESPSKRQRSSSSPYSIPSAAAPLESVSDGATYGDAVEAARQLFLDIEEAPQPLDLAAISALFHILQEEISKFSKSRFNFVLTPEQEQAWPLHLLKKEYEALFNATQNIAANPSCGWRNFFTKSAHRPHLVHGIIGEWLIQRVFKHTAFAVPDALVERLASVDREYLRYDAFVRNKMKAAVLNRPDAADFFSADPEDVAEGPESSRVDEERRSKYASHVDLKARELANQLMQVLRPLLPPPIFDPLVPRYRQTFEDKADSAKLQNKIYFDLVDLIAEATNLHHCILLAGRDGLVMHFVPHVQKGTMFTVDDADRNICVNAYELNNDEHRPSDREGRLVVKMTCFGRVQAVIPHGPDLLEMEDAQDAASFVGEELTREYAEENLFPLLPYELQEGDAGRSALAEVPPVPGTEWNAALAKSSPLKKHYERGVRLDMKPEPEPIRRPFVTLYPRVAPSNLYCEWASSPESPELFPQSAAAQQQSNPQSLEQAVAEARRLNPAQWFEDVKPYAATAFTAGGIALGAYSIYRNYGTILEAGSNLKRSADAAYSVAYSSASSAVASVSAGASSYLSQLRAPTIPSSATSSVIAPGTVGSIIYSALGSDYKSTETSLPSVVASNYDSFDSALKSPPVYTQEPAESTAQPAVDPTPEQTASIVQLDNDSTLEPIESPMQPAVDITDDSIESELKSSFKANKSDSKSEGRRTRTSTITTPTPITSYITETSTTSRSSSKPPAEIISPSPSTVTSTKTTVTLTETTTSTLPFVQPPPVIIGRVSDTTGDGSATTLTLTETTTSTLPFVQPPPVIIGRVSTTTATAETPSTPTINTRALLSNLKAMGKVPSDATALPGKFTIVDTNKQGVPRRVEGSVEKQAETKTVKRKGRSKVL